MFGAIDMMNNCSGEAKCGNPRGGMSNDEIRLSKGTLRSETLRVAANWARRDYWAATRAAATASSSQRSFSGWPEWPRIQVKRT